MMICIFFIIILCQRIKDTQYYAIVRKPLTTLLVIPGFLFIVVNDFRRNLNLRSTQQDINWVCLLKHENLFFSDRNVKKDSFISKLMFTLILNVCAVLLEFFLNSKTSKIKFLNNSLNFNLATVLFYIACFITFLFVFII